MEGNQDADGPAEGQGMANVVNVSNPDNLGNILIAHTQLPASTIHTVLKAVQGLLIVEAARENRPDVLKRLIEEGKPARATDNHGWTALHHAASLGHTECVRILLNRPRNRNRESCEIDEKAGGIFGSTALMMACDYGMTADNLRSEGCKQCIKVLCEFKANTTLTDVHDRTALHIAMEIKPDVKVVKWLVRSWKHSVQDLIDIPWADVEKMAPNGISDPISLMTRDARSDPMMCLFRPESYDYEDDDVEHAEIDGCVAKVAQYFAKLGFVKNALRAVLTGNIQKPELLETVVERFLEKGAVLKTKKILNTIQFRPAALSLFAQKSIIFLEEFPTSFEPDDYHTHLYNAFAVLILQGWVSGIVPPKAVKEFHDTLKLEPYWGIGESLPPDFGPLKNLYDMTENPPMLSQLARTKIRTQVAKCNKFSRENLRKLPLPKTLQDFVELKDLGDGSEIEKIMKRVKDMLAAADEDMEI